jgi:hypothetical protein
VLVMRLYNVTSQKSAIVTVNDMESYITYLARSNPLSYLNQTDQIYIHLLTHGVNFEPELLAVVSELKYMYRLTDIITQLCI